MRLIRRRRKAVIDVPGGVIKVDARMNAEEVQRFAEALANAFTRDVHSPHQCVVSPSDRTALVQEVAVELRAAELRNFRGFPR